MRLSLKMLPNPLAPRLSRMASPPSPVIEMQSHSAAEHSFLHPDPHYPLAYTSNANVWRGDADTLFRMSRRTKRDIQDYILGACASRNKDYNERTKPTGSKFIYVLDLNNSEEEQTALCVLPNATTFTDTHDVNGVQSQNHFNEQTASCSASTNSMTDNPSPGTLRRRGSTVSFTKMLASANEHSFPHDDRELDSDSDSDSDSDDVFSSPTPPRRTKFMAAIAEASDEEEEAATSFPIAIHVPSRYCRDPYFTGHPTCHHRARDFSYAHPASDADIDLQERFMLKHDGEASPAHYLNWRVLKWDYGQTMVHGPSLLRWKAPTPVGSPAKQLTLRGHASRASTRRGDRGSDEGAFEADRYIEEVANVGVWLVDVDESEEPLSETSTLSEEVVGTGRETEADTPGGNSPTRVVRTLPEEELLKVNYSAPLSLNDADTAQILNTSHEEFVERCENVQRRQKAARRQSSVAASSQVEANKPACYVPVGAPCLSIDTASEPTRGVDQTAPPSTPVVSPTHFTNSSSSEVDSHRAPINAAPEPATHLVQSTPPSTPEVSPTNPTHPSSPEVHILSASIDAAPKPATHLVQNAAPSTPAISPTHLPAPLQVPSIRVATPPVSSTSDSLSSPPSIFTHSASITTKPSQETVGSAQQQEATNSLPPCASEPEPRLSRRRKAKKVTKKCMQSVRGTVQRGVGGVSRGVKKMGKAMRGLCGA